MPKRFGIIPHRFAQPLFQGLKGRDGSVFTLIEDSSAQLALKLRQNELDGAFLSPIDYGKDYPIYRIVPEVAVASEGESGAVFLFFKEKMRNIETLAVDPGSGSEIVLASIILLEKYDLPIELVPVAGSIDQALAGADAYLAVGDNAAGLSHRANKLDLVDEWSDLTGLPFVHGIWVSREKGLTRNELNIIIDAGRHGAANQDNPPQFSYELSDDAHSALTEFLRMAYYHGILKDIPDLKYFSTEEMTSAG